MEDTHWLDEREARAWRALQFMQMRLNARLAADLAASSDLSYPEYVVLVALTDRAGDQMRMHELAQLLGWEKSRVSHQVARMAERGLVTKAKCGDDRRGAFVAATDQGRAEIAAAAPRHVATVRRLFLDRLTAEELDGIAGAAEKVLAALAGED